MKDKIFSVKTFLYLEWNVLMIMVDYDFWKLSYHRWFLEFSNGRKFSEIHQIVEKYKLIARTIRNVIKLE